MIILVADTERDQEMLDKFQRAYENLRKIVDKQNRKIKDLEDQLEEYKKRHPSSLGVKNGKTYDIAVSGDAQPEDILEIQEKRKPGAQPGHPGSYRIRKRPTEKLTIHLDLNECPECHSTLRRKGSRKRIIEDIPIINAEIMEYRLDRLYCMKCHRIYEPDIPNALRAACKTTRPVGSKPTY